MTSHFNQTVCMDEISEISGIILKQGHLAHDLPISYTITARGATAIRPQSTESPGRLLCRGFCQFGIRVQEVWKSLAVSAFQTGGVQKKKNAYLYPNKRSSMVRVVIQHFSKNTVISMVLGHPNSEITCIPPSWNSQFQQLLLGSSLGKETTSLQ